MMIQPFEVRYTQTGRKGRKVRDVIGVLCPTGIAQHLRLAKPIFVSLGDVEIDWHFTQSEGYRVMLRRLIDKELGDEEM